MSNILTEKSYKQCGICAYHESGHILFAYLCGYHCRHAQLIKETGEEDFSSIAIIDYGKDSFIASKFVVAKANIDAFNSLSLGEKLESVEVGRRLARIYLGGSVTAAVFNNAGNVHIPLPIQIEYIDLLRVEFIQCVIQELSTDADETFIENGLQDALYTLSNTNVWNTVTDLAERLLKSNELSQNDIEECLEEHGIIYDERYTSGLSV